MDNLQNNNQNNEDSIDISKILVYLAHNSLKILIVTIIGALLGFLYSALLVTPKYESTSKIYIVNSNSGDSQINITDLQIGTDLVSDYISLMKNRTMLDNVITDLDLDYDYDELVKMITVSNPINTRELNISVVSKDPEEAQNIANELTKQAIEYLPEITGAKAPTLVEKAVFPDKPVIPKTIRNTLLGAILGFGLAVIYYVIKFISNDSYQTSEDIQNAFGVLPLATIPEDLKTNSNKKKKRVHR